MRLLTSRGASAVGARLIDAARRARVAAPSSAAHREVGRGERAREARALAASATRGGRRGHLVQRRSVATRGGASAVSSPGARSALVEAATPRRCP